MEWPGFELLMLAVMLLNLGAYQRARQRWQSCSSGFLQGPTTRSCGPALTRPSPDPRLAWLPSSHRVHAGATSRYLPIAVRRQCPLHCALFDTHIDMCIQRPCSACWCRLLRGSENKCGDAGHGGVPEIAPPVQIHSARCRDLAQVRSSHHFCALRPVALRA